MKPNLTLLAFTMAIPMIGMAEETPISTPTTYEATGEISPDIPNEFTLAEEHDGNGLQHRSHKNAPNNQVDVENLDLPRFSIIGKDNKFFMGLGGYLKATAGFDFGNPIDNASDFRVADIPMRHTPGNGGKFSISAQQSMLYLTMGYLPGDKYEISTYINGEFLGDNYNFVIENAYLKFLGFTAGYGYGLFFDTEATPTTIDHQGPNGEVMLSNGIFDYQCTLGKWSFAIGAEMPLEIDYETDHTYKVNQRIPDVPLFVQYNLPGGGHVRVAGLIRTMQYRDMVHEKNRNAFGYGLQLSAVEQVNPKFQFFCQATTGRGISSYFQDLADMNLDLALTSTEGKLSTVKSWGGYAGVQYCFSDKVFATATYSHLRIYPRNAEPDTYRYGQYLSANIFWDITSMFQCGMEYIYGRRVNMDGIQAHNNRLQTMLQVTF
jgi:hypothetical protein